MRWRMGWMMFLVVAAMGVHAVPPLHHYRFDGGAITDSAGGCHGKVKRLAQTEGLYGKALYFPQTDKKEHNVVCGVSIPIPPETFAKPFTVTLWVKLDDNKDFRQFRELLFLGGGRGPGIRLTYFYNSLAARSGDGKKVVSVGTNSSRVVVPTGRWCQVAVAYDGAHCRIYLDAVLKAEGAIVFTQGKGALSVGSYNAGYTYPLQGALDELKIYGKALDAAEIAAAFLAEMK